MIAINNTQLIWFLAYAIAWGLLLSFVVFDADDRNYRRGWHIALYCFGFVFFMFLFLAFAYALLHFTTHFKMAAVTLVTFRFSDQHQKYDKVQTQTVTAAEAALLSQHFKTHASIDGFYAYDLIDEENKSRQNFYTVNSQLLEYIKDTQAQENLKQNPQQP